MWLRENNITYYVKSFVLCKIPFQYKFFDRDIQIGTSMIRIMAMYYVF